jgi:nucleotide-binding universal stress UspA family protein
MGPIVCATRGGEASRRTQERAIALAQERGADLIFLCIVDASFANPLNERLAVALEDELKRLGRSLLYVAEARAQERGIAAQTVCMSGPIRENIQTYLERVGASTLVIGDSRSHAIHQAFGSGKVSDFANMLRQTVNVEVIVVT